jgi:peptidoglycan hydrolase-like protein with peptidoglycan-binding domain
VHPKCNDPALSSVQGTKDQALAWGCGVGAPPAKDRATEDTMNPMNATASNAPRSLGQRTIDAARAAVGSISERSPEPTKPQPTLVDAIRDTVERNRRIEATLRKPILPAPGPDLSDLYRKLGDDAWFAGPSEQQGPPRQPPVASAGATGSGRASRPGTLRRGDCGPEVRGLQEQLRANGHAIAVDGVFGPETERALRAFQKAHGLADDGIAGQRTAAALRGEGSVAPTTPRPQPTSGARGRNRTAVLEKTLRPGARNQMVTGKITVNGRTYEFRSGGHGKGNLPPGTYTVTRHRDHRTDRGMSVDGVGYSFALSDKYDSRVGALRQLLRIHPDGGPEGTLGCIGIIGDAETQRQFRADMLAELERNGGRFELVVC